MVGRLLSFWNGLFSEANCEFDFHDSPVGSLRWVVHDTPLSVTRKKNNLFRWSEETSTHKMMGKRPEVKQLTWRHVSNTDLLFWSVWYCKFWMRLETFPAKYFLFIQQSVLEQLGQVSRLLFPSFYSSLAISQHIFVEPGIKPKNWYSDPAQIGWRDHGTTDLLQYYVYQYDVHPIDGSCKNWLSSWCREKNEVRVASLIPLTQRSQPWRQLAPPKKGWFLWCFLLDVIQYDNIGGEMWDATGPANSNCINNLAHQ